MRYYAHNHDVLSVYKLGWDTVEIITRQFGTETCCISITEGLVRFIWADATALLDDHILFDSDDNFVAVVSSKMLHSHYSAIEG